MAQRRLFSLKIVDSDAFLDMSQSAQNLYFHLGMRADDDGFVNPKKIMRSINSSEDDLKILLAKRFILPFESGVVVIKHWLIHNTILKDRYVPTMYSEEKTLLIIKENGAYTESKQNVNIPLTEVKLSKVKLRQVKISKVVVAEPPEVNLLLDYFKKTVNEHINFGNKTERKACTDLLNTYGLERVKTSLAFLEEKRKTDKYLPLITTPYELWTKWAKIKQHLIIKKPKIWKSSRSSPSLPEQSIK